MTTDWTSSWVVERPGHHCGDDLVNCLLYSRILFFVLPCFDIGPDLKWKAKSGETAALLRMVWVKVGDDGEEINTRRHLIAGSVNTAKFDLPSTTISYRPVLMRRFICIFFFTT